MRNLIIILAFFTSGILFGQNDNYFADNPNEYIDRLNDLFKYLPDKSAAKSKIGEVDRFWNSGELSDENKQKIINISNSLRRRKGKIRPHFFSFLDASMIINKSGNVSNANLWFSYIEKIIKDNKKPIRLFQNITFNTYKLLSDSALYTHRGVKWKANTNNFELKSEKCLIAKFNNINLKCYAVGDSIVIYNTSGNYCFDNNIWSGNKGKVDWEKSGCSPRHIYANLNSYNINLHKTGFKADSVYFYNDKYFKSYLLGYLEHKVMKVKDAEKTLYPRFTSYNKVFLLPNIYSGMDYKGGFSQKGASFIGSGDEENPAQITVSYKDSTFMIVKSLDFVFRKKQIYSKAADVTIYLKSGKITHPELIFKLMKDKQMLYLIRDGKGLSKTNYIDTYHNVSIDAQVITWKVDSPEMILSNLIGSANNRSVFESVSFYQEGFFNQLQGIDNMHPLQRIRNFAVSWGDSEFLVSDYAKSIGYPEGQVRQQLINLSFHGFLKYNPNTDLVIIQDKLYDYIDFRLGEKDYDMMRFTSVTEKRVPCGVINLEDRSIDVNGINTVNVSENMNVALLPDSGKITLHENRNINLDGHVKAGMISAIGKGLNFNYEQYKVEMDSVDFLQMRVLTGEKDYLGLPKETDVINQIEKLSGSLIIDEPDNKSGKKENMIYPILKSTTKSYVYYDKIGVDSLKYDKDKFYFELDTFTLDSIRALQAHNFEFSGRFSSDILPDFEEKLRLMPDYSLGFKKATSPEGIDLYEGKVHFVDTIFLCSTGLGGNGTLTFNNSETKSKNFLFRPDYITGFAEYFQFNKVKQDTLDLPNAFSEDLNIIFTPSKDKIVVNKQEGNIKMYGDKAKLKGELTIEKSKAFAKGTIMMNKANLISDSIALKGAGLHSDSSYFILTGKDLTEVSFNTKSVEADINFATQKGNFKMLSGENKVEFKDNKFMSFVSEFSWDMNKNDLSMGSSASLGTRFVSTNKRQDSLEFLVPVARYNIKEKRIYTEQVKKVDVADVKITPINGQIIINEGGDIEALDSAIVKLKIQDGQDKFATENKEDSVSEATKEHVIFNAHIKIKGRKKYNGYGEYNFINGDSVTKKIIVSDITVDDNNKTVAKGEINIKDFEFNKHFGYKGDFSIEGKNNFLKFRGGIKLLHGCANGPETYTRFDTIVDPSNILIPIGDKLQKYDFKSIYCNFYISADSAHLYSSFLQSRKFHADVPIITGKGFLNYNENKSEYQIASKQKLANNDTIGTIFKLNNETCELSAFGKLNYGVDIPGVDLFGSGTITQKIGNSKINLNSILGVRASIPNQFFKLIGLYFIKSKAKTSDIKEELIKKRFVEMVKGNDINKITDNFNNPSVRLNLYNILNSDIMFPDIDWKFNVDRHCYYKMGYANLFFVQDYIINKKIKIIAEITKSHGGDKLEMILSDDDTWFYLNFSHKQFQTLSSNKDYNDFLHSLRLDKKKQKQIREEEIKNGEKKKNIKLTLINSPIEQINKFIQKYGINRLIIDINPTKQKIIIPIN